MARPNPSAFLGALILTTLAGPASAQSLSDAATHAPPQHYMITLPPTPVAEVAEVVLGQSLGLPFKVDADVKAEMTFKVDGVYGPHELAREFGYRLWNVDVALIERPSDGLWLIPEAELPAALAAGATMVSPLASAGAQKPKAAASAPPPAPAGAANSMGWTWLAWLVAGWASGLASAAAWMRFRRPPTAPSVVLLPAPIQPEVEDLDPGLVIPSFSEKQTSLAATKDGDRA